MVKWEYAELSCSGQFRNWYIISNENVSRVTSKDGHEHIDIFEALNSLGEDGWELASKEHDYKWVLKRIKN